MNSRRAGFVRGAVCATGLWLAGVTCLPAPAHCSDVTSQRVRCIAKRGLNVRSGPSTDAPKIGSLRLDEEVDALTRSPDGEWLQVVVGPGKRTGWIAAKYVEPVGANIPQRLSQFGAKLKDAKSHAWAWVLSAVSRAGRILATSAPWLFTVVVITLVVSGIVRLRRSAVVRPYHSQQSIRRPVPTPPLDATPEFQTLVVPPRPATPLRRRATPRRRPAPRPTSSPTSTPGARSGDHPEVGWILSDDSSRIPVGRDSQAVGADDWKWMWMLQTAAEVGSTPEQTEGHIAAALGREQNFKKCQKCQEAAGQRTDGTVVTVQLVEGRPICSLCAAEEEKPPQEA